MLSINEIKSRISPICKSYDVARAYLFGSYARGDASECSDIDIRIDKGNSQKLCGLFDVSGLQLELMDALGNNMDLITMLPEQAQYDIFRHHVKTEEVLLYAAQ
ncbi:MAG: nucleotidyltransferase domain-containing protein [Selenomonadaceae bacterium]|nr:nucleotidyltransferase domain-containing protein [Selenomonadaceae bacterium]